MEFFNIYDNRKAELDKKIANFRANNPDLRDAPEEWILELM